MHGGHVKGEIQMRLNTESLKTETVASLKPGLVFCDQHANQSGSRARTWFRSAAVIGSRVWTKVTCWYIYIYVYIYMYIYIYLCVCLCVCVCVCGADWQRYVASHRSCRITSIRSARELPKVWACWVPSRTGEVISPSGTESCYTSSSSAPWWTMRAPLGGPPPAPTSEGCMYYNLSVFASLPVLLGT
jgi:hypothetical protein